MSTQVEQIRTFALIGHGGSGKTSLAEAMLFNAKMTNRLGQVDKGSSVLDFEPEEVNRNITISASFADLPWKKHQLYLMDTPGDDNFLNDARSCLQAADAAVFVADGLDGVKVQGEKVWQFAKEFGLPAVAVVNKLDRERASFEKGLEAMEASLECRPAAVALPIGAEADFKGYVDLLKEKAYLFKDNGQVEETAIPDDMADAVADGREKLIEAIAEADDSLLERYLEGEELSNEEINSGLKAAVMEGVFVPVVPTAGATNLGAAQLMDLIVAALPSPAERTPFKAEKGGEEIELPADPDAPFCGLVFKTVADPFAGRLNIVRVISGTMNAGTTYSNATKSTKERFGNVTAPMGKEQKAIDTAGPGAVIALAKLKDTSTGDTVCEEKADIIVPAAKPLPAVISYAVEAKDKNDEEKIFAGINRLLEEDVTLKLTRDPQTKDAILSGMGQVHIEVTLEKLKRKFGGEVNLKAPKVPYLETIKKKAADVQGRYKKQSGGRGQFGDCVITMEPLPRGEGFIFEDKIVGGVIPRQYIPAVEKGIVERAAGGCIAGFPLVDFKVSLTFGSYHSVDSSEMAFKVAGSMAFQKAAAEAQPVILEPIMNLEIIVPEDAMGDVMGDINSRRGKVLGMDARGTNQIIRAQAPMSEVLRYAPDLTSMTGGRGAFSMELDHYAEAPFNIQEEIVAAYEAAKEEA